MSFQVTLDGKQVDANSGETILDVAKRSGVEIPTLCHQEGLKPYGSCFICVVEIKGMGRLVPSCATPIADGMDILTNSERVLASRKVCIELLLSDHVGDCRAPCQVECPAGIDVPAFISLLEQNNTEDAVKIIKDVLPFPSSLGRVCPRPCETQCHMACSSNSLSICFLKRYIGDDDLKGPSPYIPKVGKPKGKKVSIVGAGPAGLTAAFYLRKMGYDVDVMDSHSEPGGMLRYGIPEYRLPRDVLAAEIDIIRKMGANIQCNKSMPKDFTINSLIDKSDAVFLAIGAQRASDMRVEGEHDGGAISGIAFLDDIANGKKVDVGDEVVVVGGGNTAIDAARTSLRLGSKNVTILYRRTQAEMPADDIEIDAAIEEGVKMHFLAAPVKMSKTEAGTELECVKMELGEPDASGRRRPVPKKGSEFKIQATAVISAIGQGVDSDCVDADATDIKLTKWYTLDVDPDTFLTSREGVFAGGDCATGADIAVTAIAAGRKAAVSIDQYLRGEKVTGEAKRYYHLMGEKPTDSPPAFIEKIETDAATKMKMPELPAKERIENFEEVETGFTLDDALSEAKRCEGCGCRSFDSCKLQNMAEEYGAKPERFAGERREYFVDDSHPIIRYESHKCIMCGSCIRVCSEEKELNALGFIGRGFSATMRPMLERLWDESSCDSCLKCVPLCPTGAISIRTTPAEEALARRDRGVDASKEIPEDK